MIKMDCSKTIFRLYFYFSDIFYVFIHLESTLYQKESLSCTVRVLGFRCLCVGMSLPVAEDENKGFSHCLSTDGWLDRQFS